MRWKILTLAVIGLLLAPAAIAQDNQDDESDAQITIVAPEECPDDTQTGGDGDPMGDQDQNQNQDQNQTDSQQCLELEEGNLEDISEGDQVELTFENEQSQDATLHVANMSDADVGGDTDEQDAVASTSDVSQGEDDTTNFTAPADGDELYFWVEDREEDGLYLTATGTQDGVGDDQRETEPADGFEDDAQDDTQDDTPAPGLLIVALAGVGAAFVLRRR